MKDYTTKRIEIAEARINELLSSGDIKKITQLESESISRFYADRSRHRLESAKMLYTLSSNKNKRVLVGASEGYADYSEVVSTAYYAMYYIVHSFLAREYHIKLKENVRGVHIITEYAVLYYLVKTGILAKHLYEEYIRAFETVADIQNVNEFFNEEAFKFVKLYSRSRDAREDFTYKVIYEAEEYRANQAIQASDEFINTIRGLMIN